MQHLKNKRIALTGLEGSELVKILESQGAEVVQLPMIQVKPPSSWLAFDELLQQNFVADWVIFSSKNGVEFTLERLRLLGFSANYFKQSQIACVGRATAQSLQKFGIETDLIPEFFQSEGLLHALQRQDFAQQTYWLLQAEAPRTLLQEQLTQQGATVIATPVYQIVSCAKDSFSKHQNLLDSLDWIVFTSPSTVQHFFECATIHAKMADVQIACIGQVTAQKLRHYSMQPAVVPETQDMKHLAHAIVEWTLS